MISLETPILIFDRSLWTFTSILKWPMTAHFWAFGFRCFEKRSDWQAISISTLPNATNHLRLSPTQWKNGPFGSEHGI